MSLRYVMTCDRSGPYGTCAARLYTGTASEAEAREVAEQAGWDSESDLCPGHNPRPCPPTQPVLLHPTRSS